MIDFVSQNQKKRKKNVSNCNIVILACRLKQEDYEFRRVCAVEFLFIVSK